MRTIRVLSWLMALILLLGAAHAEAALPDGEYAPDGFAFSGGSGRVTISCTKLRIVGGETLVTLVFSSPNYTKLVADGVEYAATHDGDTSVFEIDSITGVITLKDSLDYETKPEYKLVIEVDDGEFTDKATVTVKVDNVIETPKVEITRAETTDLSSFKEK